MFTDYIAVTQSTPLPTLEEVKTWWDEYKMLENIRAHSEMVCNVAVLIYDWLADSGVELRKEAIITGALVHDIAKTQCLNSSRLHSEEGSDILIAKGYPELAYLVRQHVQLPHGHPLDETMVVNYADKRVKHDQVVDLQDRYDYIAERYGRKDPLRLKSIAQGKKRAFEVEDCIFQKIGKKHSPTEIQMGLWETDDE